MLFCIIEVKLNVWFSSLVFARNVSSGLVVTGYLIGEKRKKKCIQKKFILRIKKSSNDIDKCTITYLRPI